MLGLNILKKPVKFIAIILFSAFIAIGSFVAYKSLISGVRTETTVLTLIKSEDLTFLVTDKLISQICAQISENSPLLGKREGILIGTVTMYYGVNLEKINIDSIKKNENGFVITLPEVEELDFSVDLDSLKYITKRSGLNIIADYILDRDFEKDLRSQMKKSALAFFKDKKLIPTKTKIASKLDSFFKPIADNSSTNITFE